MRGAPRWLYGLVAVSGASALVYELIWIRALGLHFGTTTPAIATVVASFMGGMGLGNAVFGPRADRSPKPLALYRAIELGIAASGLLVSLFLLRGGSALDALARLCAEDRTWLRVPVFALLMLLPTTLIGGTLPVLTRAIYAHGHAGRLLGALYACNTTGAIVGALSPDFVSIPRLGLTATACAAAAGNAFVASFAGRLMLGQPAAADRKQPADDARAVSEAPAAPSALVLSFALGFAGMGLELLWSRTLAHWTSALASSFSVLLAVYLAALALGAALARRRADRVASPERTAGLLCALAGAAALLPVALAPAWRNFERWLWPRPAELRRAGLLREAIDALLHATFLEAGACVLMGAAFPYIAALWLRGGRPGERTGLLFSVNTAAGVLGACAVGFAWLPGLGELGSYCGLALLLTLAGTAASLATAPRRGVRTLVASGCSALSLLASLALPGDYLVRTHFRSGGHLLAVREGSTTTAAAAQRFDFGEPAYLELLTPGVSMSDTSQGARHYMGVMAHAGLLAARTPARALLICYGVGNTASALLAHSSLRQLDVVDISEEVLALAPWFGRARTFDPLRDPRTHVFVDDGRHRLITHAARYDLITAEPPPPNHAGVANLYSREFYRLARARLAPGGALTQWLPVSQLADDEVRAMIAAFTAEFAHTALLSGLGHQFVLIGSPQPFAIDLELAARRANEPRVRADLRASGIGDVADLLGSVLQTDRELRRLVRGVRPLSDDLPVIQYPWAALRGYPDYGAIFGKNPARATALLAPTADARGLAALRAAGRATEELTSILHLLAALPEERAEIVLSGAIRRALAERPASDAPLELLGLARERSALASRALAQKGAAELLARPTRATSWADRRRRNALEEAALMLARRAFQLGDCATTQRWLTQLDAPEDRSLRALLSAGCLRVQGHALEAAAGFDRAASLSRDPSFARLAHELASRAAQPFPGDRGPIALE